MTVREVNILWQSYERPWRRVVYEGLCLSDDEEQVSDDDRECEDDDEDIPPVDLRAVCLVRAIVDDEEEVVKR